jgi:hypothetical protein
VLEDHLLFNLLAVSGVSEPKRLATISGLEIVSLDAGEKKWPFFLIKILKHRHGIPMPKRSRSLMPLAYKCTAIPKLLG